MVSDPLWPKLVMMLGLRRGMTSSGSITKSRFGRGFSVCVLLGHGATIREGESPVVRIRMTLLAGSVTMARGDRGLRLETLICSSYDLVMDRDSSSVHTNSFTTHSHHSKIYLHNLFDKTVRS